jgi:hypothetical protein
MSETSDRIFSSVEVGRLFWACCTPAPPLLLLLLLLLLPYDARYCRSQLIADL